MSGSHFDSGPSLMGRVAICLAIAANALSAGGIFIFPLLSPALASLLKLSQPQLTTIVLAGMIGQYPFSAFVGKLFDKYGPASCSLVAAALFGLSFHFFAAEVTNGTTVQTPQTSASLFRNLVALFLLSGLGTVFSYFSAVFAATKTFPLYPGIASGTSMALFGLSPLLLTTIAASKFVDPETGLLNIVSFMEFLAIYTTSIHILASIALRHVPKHDTVVVESQQENAEPTEQSTLLPPKPIPTSPGSEGADSLLELNGQSTISLLQDPNFWLLGLYCLLVFGACEMVMGNMGTIVLSLDPRSPHLYGSRGRSDQPEAIAKQVRLISLSNTLSRVVVGPLADFLCPVIISPRASRRFGRTAFLSVTALLVAFAFTWMEVAAYNQSDAWFLSVGIGATYGATFAVLPSIVSAVWGAADLGRNFGIVTYAPFIGTPLFSYLYAFVAAAHAQDGLCRGTGCWRVSFWISCGTSIIAFCVSCILYRRWRGLL